MNWLIFALMTVFSWGVYGVLLHKGQMAMNIPGMPPDPNARYKAFLFVGIAYFLTAVLAPLGMLVARKASWSMPGGGMTWSLVAGIAGAVGAFCVLLAFGARGTPSVVMSIVFAGAPVINAVVAYLMHPPEGKIRWQFFLGIALAAIGGCMVTLFKDPVPVKTAATVQTAPGSQKSQ